MTENQTLPVTVEPNKKRGLLIILLVLLLASLSLSAFLGYQNWKLQKQITKLSIQPTPLPTPTATPDPTANWKTFNKNGMEFKYPAEWRLNNTSNILTSENQKITLVSVPKDNTLMNECMDMVSQSTVSNVVVKKFARVSAGEMCTTDDTSARAIWVVESSNSFAPGLSYQYSVQNSVEAEKIFNLILSTFKFVNQQNLIYTKPLPIPSHSDTTFWRSFVDDKLKISFRYPQNYNITYHPYDNSPILQQRINWYVIDSSIGDCRGDCSVILSTEKVFINGLEGKKYKGWVGAVGGNIPQSFISYEIKYQNSQKNILIELWELDKNLEITPPFDRKIPDISSADEKIFDQIISTFQINK